MTPPPDPESVSSPDPTNQIRQTIDQNQGQMIAQMMGGLAVGQLTVYLSQTPTEKAATASVELGQNPYQGLKAFRETDGDRFFGRDTQIQKLWRLFQQLHNDRNTTRVLPIYGPSGSGKSSLARAGLIPALGKNPLPGRDRGRVVVLTPGNHPLEALAAVLARIATNDATPVAKTREFKDELLQSDSQQAFDGLRRIADVFPDINSSPLIVLVDQFEEVYTLCDDESERYAFVENLLCAASDTSQRVSVILTLRSDFLGATQQYPRLNQLFSSQGFLAPIMQPEELAIAITEPAKQAGYELSKAIVQLLVKETRGQDGALPLLQFALTQIWEGLRNGVEPADTLEQIGGVGGALANEAKRLYHSLTPEQQGIARAIFLALIQLNEDNKSTRRRAPISELITSEQDAPLVQAVIDRFARPGVWILVTFSNEQQVEMVEVAHEALIQNWKELREWLKEHWEALRKKRKLEQAAVEWQDHQKNKDYLLQERMLRNAKEFVKEHKDNPETRLSSLAINFIKESRKVQKINLLKIATLFIVFPVIGTFIVIHFWFINIAQSVLSREECEKDFAFKALLNYMLLTGYKDELEEKNFCKEDLQEVNLAQATLWRANFQESNLAKANFQRAFLVEANFQGADLYRTDFSESFLKEASFENSYLFETNLENAIGLDAAQLRKARICNAKLPTGIGINPKKDCK